MKYYEFKEPYYALVSAENDEQAIYIYEEEVCLLNENLMSTIHEVTMVYALLNFAKHIGIDKCLSDKSYLEDFKSEGVLLVEYSLA